MAYFDSGVFMKSVTQPLLTNMPAACRVLMIVAYRTEFSSACRQGLEHSRAFLQQAHAQPRGRRALRKRDDDHLALVKLASPRTGL